MKTTKEMKKLKDWGMTVRTSRINKEFQAIASVTIQGNTEREYGWSIHSVEEAEEEAVEKMVSSIFGN